MFVIRKFKTGLILRYRQYLRLTKNLFFIFKFQKHAFQFPDYAFQVNPVKKCPMSKEAWDISSARMNCNKTHGYHCVPNKNFTSLIEFCYPRGEKIPFHKGTIIISVLSLDKVCKRQTATLRK